MRKTFKQIILKMKEHSSLAILYTENLDYDQFISDQKTIDACVFNIGQIGELASLVSNEYRNQFGFIDWVAIKSVRNRIVHDYEGVRFDMIWDIIKISLPKLVNDLDVIIQSGNTLKE